MIPQRMHDANRRLIWEPIKNAKTGKIDNITLDPRTKKRFKRGSGYQTDAALWVSHDEAVNAGGSCLGFLLGPDGPVNRAGWISTT